MSRQILHTDQAPKAIGPYSQAVRVGDTVYMSGQIALDPSSGELLQGDIEAEARRVFDNVAAIAAAAGSSLDDVVRLTVYLTDLGLYAKVNEIMQQYFHAPYPARAAIGVAALPRGARIEVECILSLA